MSDEVAEMTVNDRTTPLPWRARERSVQERMTGINGAAHGVRKALKRQEREA